MLDALVQTSDTWALLPIRLALGAIFIGHGGQKLFGSAGTAPRGPSGISSRPSGSRRP